MEWINFERERATNMRWMRAALVQKWQEVEGVNSENHYGLKF